jgi:hypothetical protein
MVVRGCGDVDYDVMIYTSDMAPRFLYNCRRIPFVAIAELSYPVLVMPFKTPVMPLCIHIIQILLFPKLPLQKLTPHILLSSYINPSHLHNPIYPCLFPVSTHPSKPIPTPSPVNSPLLMLRILGANNINITALLPPNALTPITQLLD